MNIKIFVTIDSDSELLVEKEENIHTSNMYLSAKSIYHNYELYDVMESVLDTDKNQIQITVEKR